MKTFKIKEDGQVLFTATNLTVPAVGSHYQFKINNEKYFRKVKSVSIFFDCDTNKEYITINVAKS